MVCRGFAFTSVSPSYHQLPSPLHQLSRFASVCSIGNFSWDLSWWLLFRFWPPWDIVIDSFSVTCLLFNLLERLSSVALWAGIRYWANQMRRHLSYPKRTAEKPCVTSVTQTSPQFFNQILSFCKRPEQRKDKDRTRTVTFVACYTFCLVA